jgi:hypothetical protein
MSDEPAAAPAAAALPPATATSPPSLRELALLHGGLLLTNVIWSFMHVIMCGSASRARPARRAANKSLPLRTGLCHCAKARTLLC